MYQRELRNPIHYESLSDNSSIHISLTELTLSEYITACNEYCINMHNCDCKCSKLIEVGNKVLKEGYCLLSTAFHIVSPNVNYTAQKGRRLLLKMPFASIRIGDPHCGKSSIIIMEKFSGMDYAKIGLVLNNVSITKKQESGELSKACVKMLLTFAQSDRERESLRYAIFKSSGLSQKEVRRKYGFESMSSRAAKVEDVLKETNQSGKLLKT